MIERQKLSDFAGNIHNLFGLQEQARGLIALVTKAIGCKYACLLFLNVDGKDFTVLVCDPKSKDNPLSSLTLSRQNPIVKYLKRKKKLLPGESLATLPDFKSLWEPDGGGINSEIELLMPLISRDRLIGILVLGEKHSGGYSLEDYNLLAEVADQVAVSMEKEYLREQLSQHKEELSVINRSSVIMTSSLDIQLIFDSFIEELRKIVDISWAAITLIRDSDLYFLALSSEIGSAWKTGERVPIKGTATKWAAAHKKPIVEADLSHKSRFVTAESHLKQGVRSIAYLPLIAKDRAIGSLIVASRHPNAYNQSQITLLEELTSQITPPIENSQLYAEVEEKARIDGLTGLLNRRSLDESIVSEIGRHSRYGGIFSLIILDLDHLKVVNDNYGHPAGDALLREIGSIMKDTIRSADQAFR